MGRDVLDTFFDYAESLVGLNSGASDINMQQVNGQQRENPKNDIQVNAYWKDEPQTDAVMKERRQDPEGSVDLDRSSINNNMQQVNEQYRVKAKNNHLVNDFWKDPAKTYPQVKEQRQDQPKTFKNISQSSSESEQRENPTPKVDKQKQEDTSKLVIKSLDDGERVFYVTKNPGISTSDSFESIDTNSPVAVKYIGNGVFVRKKKEKPAVEQSRQRNLLPDREKRFDAKCINEEQSTKDACTASTLMMLDDLSRESERGSYSERHQGQLLKRHDYNVDVLDAVFEQVEYHMCGQLPETSDLTRKASSNK